jgi:hypothetical protein
MAVSEGMAAINQNAQQGVSLSDVDMGVALSTGLADLKAPVAPPSPNSDVQIPLLPGEKPAGSDKGAESEQPTNETLEALSRKTNTKLDELIVAVKRLA